MPFYEQIRTIQAVSLIGTTLDRRLSISSTPAAAHVETTLRYVSKVNWVLWCPRISWASLMSPLKSVTNVVRHMRNVRSGIFAAAHEFSRMSRPHPACEIIPPRGPVKKSVSGESDRAESHSWACPQERS